MTYTISVMQSDSKENVYVYEENMKKTPLNSLYSPEREAERFLKKLAETKKQFIIFIGFGNGVLLESLVDSKVYDENVHFLFIEPFSEVKLQEEHVGKFSTTKKLSFIYATNFTSIYFAEYLSKFIGIQTSIQIHPNYIKTNEAKIKDCLKIINEGIETKKILNTTEMKFASDWILEPLVNLSSMERSVSIKELQGKFKGERAMLVASGPSLKKHMDFIKKNKHTYHLFSLGPSLRPLLENDIEPEFTLSIDSGEVNYESHFKGIDYNGTLIYETTSNSKIQANHKGDLIVVKSTTDYTTSRYYKDLYSFPIASPSVAIFTLQVIAFLGFSEVYLVGQDLALINGDYYAEGIKHTGISKDMKEELVVEDNQGGLVGTTKSLKIFLEAFEHIIKILPPEIKVYNLSENGAKITGVEHISESSIVGGDKNVISYSRAPIESSNKPNLFLEEFTKNLNNLANEVNKALNNLERFTKNAIFSSKNMEKVLVDFRRVSKNEILDKVILSHITFMFHRITNTFMLMDQKKNYTNADCHTLVEELKNFYSLVSNYCDKLLKDERLNL